MKLMSILNRISAWVLLICFILFSLTGVDIMRRLFLPRASTVLHLKYLFVPAQIAFIFHSAFAIHLSLKKRNWWNGAGKAALALYVAANLALMGYFIFFQFID